MLWLVGAAVVSQPEGQAEEPTVRIAVDPASNSLVVVGSPRLTERVLELARLIEQQMPAEPTSVRIVTLPASADARAIQQLVSQTVGNVGRVSADNPGGFTGRVAVAPDPSETALIVWANETDFQTVGRLIASLASLEAQRSLTVKIYPLSNVTAAGAASAIQDLFQITPRGRQAQRLRGLDLTVVAPGEAPVRGAVDPSFVTVTPDPGGTSVIVAAPDEAIGLIDGLISLLDQSPVADRLAIRRYALENARATELSPTLQQLFEAQRQGPGANDLPRARFIADDRTNSMLVTASASQHEEIVRLLGAADVRQAEDGLALAILPLAHAQPSTVQRIVEQVLIGRDPGRRERIQISAEDQSGLLVVRASEEDLADVRSVVAEVDTSKVADLPVRAIRLHNADAQTVSQALRQFYQDRAQATQRAGRRAGPGVAITGDRRSGTVVIAASDEDFEQLRSLASTFDEAAPSKEMRFNIVQLQHVRVTDIGDTVTNISWELQNERMPWFGPRPDAASADKLFVSPNEHTNSIVLMGQGETMEMMERIIASLDQPRSDLTALVVRAVPVRNADPQALANVIQRSMVTPGWRTWRGPDPDAVTVEVDRRRRTLILVGKGAQIERAQEYIEQLDTASGRPDQVIESIRLEHAQADRAGNSLRQFFLERARAEGLPEDALSIIGSRDGNVLLVSADPVSMGMIRDMVAQLDQPELGPDRRREMYYLQNTSVADAANVLREQFPATGRAEDRVIVTAQPSTNSLIVSAPGKVFAQVDGLVAMLDEVRQVGSIVTIGLEKARVQEVVEALRAALPENLKVKITPVVRSNSIMLTGSDEAIAQVQEHVRRLDVEPEQQMQQFKVVRLNHALATDVRFTLNLLLRNRPRGTGEPDPSIDFNSIDNTLSILATPDQMRQIGEMIEQLDVPSGPGRKTEFVKLEFADAEQTAKALGVFYGRFAAEATTAGARNATIIADPTSNSLVISADEGEWENIRALLSKLDTEEYDTSRQLVVIPLKHADATSVARALNEGFRAQLQDQVQAEQLRRAQDQANRGVRQDERSAAVPPPVLVSAEGTPSVSAEVFTNSLIVSAGRQELLRIERVVEQLDVPGFAATPEPTVIPIDTGRASQVAQAIREMFQSDRIRRSGPGAVLVYGDDASNALIVRAEGTELAQIRALAQAIVSGSGLRVSPHVLRLTSIPAARLQQTIRATFTPVAQQLGETLSVEVDRTTNSLVIAASPGVYEQIERVVRELDTPAVAPDGVDQPIGAGGIAPGVFIIDVQNNSAEAVRQMLEQMGVTRPPQGDRPGVVSEPVTLIPLKTRQALAVIAGAHDGQVIVGLVRALDAAPADATQHASVIQLRLASADALVQTLRAMLDPSQQASGSSQAAALSEHVRRLNLRPTGLDEGRLELDLSKPIRLVPDVQSNAVVIASTEANVRVMESVVRSLDTLPIGDAVVVRIFPLENSAAVRVRGIIEQLFSQGEALRRLPGTQRRGQPSTATGQALAGEIAVSVDERTNALIVAGREEAVALVEVLIRDLDDDRAERWVEPTIIRLAHADARTVAATLRSVLIDSQASTPEIAALRNQAARVRMVQKGGDPMDPASRIESDIFAPLVGLSITPETDLNSIIVVGTPANLRLVNELVSHLDVELAAAGNLVRFFPLKHALADRVGAIIGDVFRQREQAGSLRQEDRLVISSDVRTNSLIVATSQRSFEVVGSLIESLDTADASYSVGLHVIPVPDGNVTQLAASLDRLMRDRIAATQRAGSVQSPADVFSIVPDATNNLLILACSDENLQLVRDFIDALRRDANAILLGERVALIQLKAARAADAVQSINSLYVQRENERRGAGSVLVVPNPRLNALIVSGTQDDVNVIRGLVERLDTNEIATVQDVRRIELKSANAIEVVQLIQGVLAGRSLSGAAGGQAVRLRYFRDQVAQGAEGLAGRDMTEAEVDDFIREQVRITPDLRTNSVMVAAPTQIVDLVSAIVSDLDMSRAGSRKIEHYRLVNADARAMATLLRDLFNLQQQGDRLVLIPTGMPGAEDDPTLGGLGRTNVTAVPDVRQELSITIDARTNSLLVSGTEEYLELVGDVVRELDSIQANEREQMVVHLANARAMDVEQTLQGYFQSEADRLQRTLSAEMQGSAARQLENEVTIVGDEKSNKLLISASPRYLDTVERIVRELDAAPPQVMIQVLLAEVTLDAENTWGFDVRVGGDTGLGNDAYKIGVFAAGTGVSSAIGTPNIAVSSLDFELLIRALEVQGKLEVLSRPQVTVRNNEIARIQVGEDIGLVSAFDRSDTGNVRSDVERREIGIILQVVPTISPDGFVRMDIRPEISTLSQREIQISENLSSPVINVRKVETTVAVMDGQTVVIGGLIQTTAEERENRIPFFGHLPVVGGLFRSNVKQNQKTELLVILTPRIVPGGEGSIERYQRLSDGEIMRISDPNRVLKALDDTEVPKRLSPQPMDEFPADAPKIPADERRGEPDADSMRPVSSGVDWDSVPRFPADRARREEMTDDGR
ncbi:MAG TPA: secretin N-terminal domain-containing protein [Phycisphaerales bacterium]|nr:secretin N-terminal domain-containing protein [Phycisphaerales bacterium]